MEKIAITALVTIVAIIFISVFKSRLKIDFKAPFMRLKMKGENENTSFPGVVGENLKAGKDINATDEIGHGVSVKKAEAKGSITLTNKTSGGGSSSPKQ